MNYSNTPMSDESQWPFLLAALDRIEVRLQRLSDADSVRAATLISIKDDVHRVETDVELKIAELYNNFDKRIKPIEVITEKVYATKIVLLGLFGAMVTIAAAIGAWLVIEKSLLH